MATFSHAKFKFSHHRDYNRIVYAIAGEFVISRKLLRRRHIRKVQRKKRKAQEDEQRLQKRRGTEICHDDLKWGASKNLVHYAFLLDGDILSDTETGGKGGDSDPKYTKDKILP